MPDWTIDDKQQDLRIEGGIGDVEGPSMRPISSTTNSNAPDEGPCLYLGPAGQRCYRRAIAGGFCAEHQPGAAARRNIGKKGKVAAAIAGIGGALWPYIYDFIHQLLRILHPR